MLTPQTIADIGRFLDQHTLLAEDAARAILRAAASVG